MAYKQTGVKPKAKRGKYKPKTRDQVVKILEGIIKRLEEDEQLATIDRIINKHKIRSSTWHSWRQETYKDDEEIQLLFEEIDFTTRDRLVQGALGGGYNPWFTKFLLVAKHDFEEKQKVELDANVKAVTSITVSVGGEDVDV